MNNHANDNRAHAARDAEWFDVAPDARRAPLWLFFLGVVAFMACVWFLAWEAATWLTEIL